MQRIFRPYDYDATLQHRLRVADVLPPEHLARCLAAFLADLDLSDLYALYYPIGPHPYDPRVMLALWLYSYMTGVRSARKLEQAIHENIPFYYLAAGQTPDHTALAEFRTLVLAYSPTLFKDILARASQEDYLSMHIVSHDGTKIHANASKHQAVSYQRAGELIHDLQQQMDDLRRRAQDDPASLPAEVNLAEELAMRQARITRLHEARTILEARAETRYQAEMTVYDEKCAARAERARQQDQSSPRGKAPTPPAPGPRPKDQYNFTDPASQIMKNSTNKGFDQHYNGQLTVAHQGRFIVGCDLSNHASDTQEALPAFVTIPAALGTPDIACFDHGFWRPETVAALITQGITPYIAVGKTVHGLDLDRYYGTHPAPPPAPDAGPLLEMAYQLQTAEGREAYRERKSTVEPVIGIIKEILGFRQFSLRGEEQARGEWRLVCSAYNLKRLFTLRATARTKQAKAQAQTVSFSPKGAHFGRFSQGTWRAHLESWFYQLTSSLIFFIKASAPRLATGC